MFTMSLVGIGATQSPPVPNAPDVTLSYDFDYFYGDNRAVTYTDTALAFPNLTNLPISVVIVNSTLPTTLTAACANPGNGAQTISVDIARGSLARGNYNCAWQTKLSNGHIIPLAAFTLHMV